MRIKHPKSRRRPRPGKPGSYGKSDWSPYVAHAARGFQKAGHILYRHAGGVRRAHERL